MLKYGRNKKFNPHILHRLSIDRQTIELIPRASRVLDIGCATGFMGEYLKKEKDCSVVGIELGRDEALQAKKVLDYVIIGNAEDEDVINKVKGKFDVVIASAIIEHLKDPWSALRLWRRLLSKNGLLIVTTSNITHWSTRASILKGNFDYKDYGILDNTHLRFFNTKTFPKLVKDSGFNVVKFSIDPVGGGFPKISLFLSKYFPNLFAYQMLIMARADK